jgi:hypothetical protein
MVITYSLLAHLPKEKTIFPDTAAEKNKVSCHMWRKSCFLTQLVKENNISWRSGRNKTMFPHKTAEGKDRTGA